MQPITRQEQLLDSIATGNSVELEPITREEQYLSAIAGLTDFIPEKPITRKEMFYQKILESGGGGGSNTLKNIVAPTDTTGLERVVIIESEEQSMIYYRVADFVPFDRYKGCEILCRLEPGAPLEWITGGEKGEAANLLETGSYTDVYMGLIGVAQDNETIEIGDGMAFTFPKAGIYFLMFNDSFVVQEVVFAELTQTKTVEVTENGTYKITPDSGKVLSSVTAKVNVPERYDEGFAEGKEQGLSEGYSSGFGAGVNSVKLQEKTVIENGDVLPDEGFNGMSKVTVDVPTSGGGKEEQEKTVTITENGTTEVIPDEGKTLSRVTVETNVAGSGEIGKPYIDTSKITDFSYFHNEGARLNLVELCDYSGGKKFNYTFAKIGTNEIKNNGYQDTDVFWYEILSNLNLGFPTSLDHCFSQSTIKKLPQMNTERCTNFRNLIQSSANISEVELDISNGTSFDFMFSACSALTTVTLTTAKKDLSTNSFNSCTALTNLTIGEGWAVSIYLTYSNNLTVESLHGMIENLADLTGATAKNFAVGATNLAKIDEEHIAMLQAKNWNYS